MRLALIALLAAAPAIAAAPAVAQSYPDRPVTIVVPFPPGGSVDGVARILGQELGERTGKSYVVENRAGGAGGSVGSGSVARATADGYTLLFNASIHVVQPLINANIKYDVVKDFSHVALVAVGPLLVTTHPSVPANTLKEFFTALKAEPKKYTIVTSGLGSAGHLTLEFLRQQHKIDAPILPYRGAGPALNDLLGGHVHLFADPMLSSLPHVRDGKLKALAVTTAKRTKLAPNVPTIEENGLPPFEMASWYGLWGPAGVPKEAMAYLGREVQAVVASAKFTERLTKLGFEPTFRDGAGLETYVLDEIAKVKPIIAAGKIKVE